MKFALLDRNKVFAATGFDPAFIAPVAVRSRSVLRMWPSHTCYRMHLGRTAAGQPPKIVGNVGRRPSYKAMSTIDAGTVARSLFVSSSTDSVVSLLISLRRYRLGQISKDIMQTCRERIAGTVQVSR